MEKKYQIFISSTYEDLIEERRKVQDAILSMYQFPIGMEMFSAADEEQWQIIKETIDSSDYYVLIIAYRYGSIIESGEEKGISYTEKEYRYAVSRKIPVLAFLADEKSVAVTPDKIEKDEDSKRKLARFKEEVRANRIIDFWKSKQYLAKKVIYALSKQMYRNKRPGWVRADLFDIEETQKEIIDLNKKLRRLEEENASLKKSTRTRNPVLKLEINDKESLSLPFLEDRSNRIDCAYVKLTMDLVPEEAKGSITQQMLDEYNNQLPPEEELKKYREEMRFFMQAKNSPFPISLRVCNDGNQKANDLYIEVIFPEEIAVYEKNKEFTAPDAPSKGVSPIDRFFWTRAKERINMVVPVHSDRERRWNTALFRQSMVPNKHFYNEGNSISIRMENLMNGYTWEVEDAYILVPKKRGTFEAECHFMCEEYEETVIQKIQIVAD